MSSETRNPAGSSATTPSLPPELRILQRHLRTHIAVLAGDIGPRHIDRDGSLARATDYISTELRAMGFDVKRHPYECEGKTIENVAVSVTGVLEPDRLVVVGAHYDTVPGTPGANDNATGIAAVLELARDARNSRPDRTIQFVFFPNEEMPYFHTEHMGSWQYAHMLHQDAKELVGMINIESIGYFTDAANSQHYPPALQSMYPTVGNFIAFAANVESTTLLRRVVEVFRKASPVPAEAAAVPSDIPGVAWSDQWGFWEHEYPALMVTDTAPFRYPHYHTPQDTPDQLDYARLTLVVAGIGAAIRDLSIEP